MTSGIRRSRRFSTAILSTLLVCGCVPDSDDAPTRRRADVDPSCARAAAAATTSIERSESTVTVYVADQSAPDLEELAHEIESLVGVQRVTTMTKVESLERAKRLFTDNPDVMANLPGNPFPALITAKVDPDRRDEVVRAVRRLRGVDDIESQNGADRLLRRAVHEYRHGDRRAACRMLAALDTTGALSDRSAR